HLTHVGVRDLRGDARLIEEHGDEALVLGVLRKDPFEHEVFLESRHAGQPRQEDLGHASDGEPREERILAEGAGERRDLSARPRATRHRFIINGKVDWWAPFPAPRSWCAVSP